MLPNFDSVLKKNDKHFNKKLGVGIVRFQHIMWRKSQLRQESFFHMTMVWILNGRVLMRLGNEEGGADISL